MTSLGEGDGGTEDENVPDAGNYVVGNYVTGVCGNLRIAMISREVNSRRAQSTAAGLLHHQARSQCAILTTFQASPSSFYIIFPSAFIL